MGVLAVVVFPQLFRPEWAVPTYSWGKKLCVFSVVVSIFEGDTRISVG